MCSAHTCCCRDVDIHTYYSCRFLQKALYIFTPQRSVCLLFLSSDYIISSLYLFLPHGRLYSSLYHIIMPKGAWACGHVHCLRVCFRQGLSERFTSEKDTEKDKVCVHVCVLTKCLWVCVCVCVWVCALLSVCCAHCQRGLSGRI